jgi:hypothetical protein
VRRCVAGCVAAKPDGFFILKMKSNDWAPALDPPPTRGLWFKQQHRKVENCFNVCPRFSPCRRHVDYRLARQVYDLGTGA